MAAYLAFHASGHNAGCEHFRDNAGTPPHNSYMSAGCYVSKYYLGINNYSTVPIGDYNYESIEQFIIETMATGDFEKRIKEKIYER